MKKSTTWTVFFYGLFIIALGYYGYYEGGSQVSLWSGLVLGGLLLLSAAGMAVGRVEGAYSALAFTVLLTGVFAYRYTVTTRPIPAIMAVVSGGMLLFLLARIAKWRG